MKNSPIFPPRPNIFNQKQEPIINNNDNLMLVLFEMHACWKRNTEQPSTFDYAPSDKNNIRK
jgi:hypothetical protein